MRKLLTGLAVCGMLLVTGCAESPPLNTEMQEDPGTVTAVFLDDDRVHIKRVVGNDIYIDSYPTEGYELIDTRTNG